MQKTFTLREFYEKYPEVHNTMGDLITSFCIHLFFLNQTDPLESDFGAGICVILGEIKGILTNHYVAEIFIARQHGHVYNLHPETCRLIPLKFKQIISLPKSANTNDQGVDIAFIELAPEVTLLT